MKYASVCSGVEAATLAWESLGWEPVWFSQYDPEHKYKQGPDFPSAVLAARWPHVPNLGDMTKLKEHEVYKNEPFDLLVGGTPCQGFSIAGLRKGLDDSRGQLTLEFVRILKEKQPRWFVWENVPGVLTSNDGRDFASFIGALKSVGYSFSWRIIDAQYCGVPQRRRRVFVVGHLGDDWRPSAAVLFEPQSMPGYFKPSRAQEQGATAFTASSFGAYREGFQTLRASGGDLGGGSETLITNAEGAKGLPFLTASNIGKILNNQTPLLVGALDTECGFQKQTHQSVKAGHVRALPLHDKATRFQGGGDMRSNDGAGNGLGAYSEADPMYTLTSGDKHGAFISNTVRRLTPVECERLQGMPDHHTNIIWKGKPAPEGQRYKAIGNSMAVPVMHWIGKRIYFVDEHI